jgi:hypothetical protein
MWSCRRIGILLILNRIGLHLIKGLVFHLGRRFAPFLSRIIGFLIIIINYLRRKDLIKRTSLEMLYIRIIKIRFL